MVWIFFQNNYEPRMDDQFTCEFPTSYYRRCLVCAFSYIVTNTSAIIGQYADHTGICSVVLEKLYGHSAAISFITIKRENKFGL